MPKRDRGEAGTSAKKAGAGDKAALKKADETARWQHYASIPKKHWVQLSGRQHKVLDEQASRYGIPILGSLIDLAAVARWLHDFLARNARRLGPEDDLPLGDSDWAERYREERTLLLRLERHEREGSLVSREKSHQCWLRVAAVLHAAGETLQRQFGAAALRILNRALQDATRDVDSLFSDGPEPDRTNDGDGNPRLPDDGADARDPQPPPVV